MRLGSRLFSLGAVAALWLAGMVCLTPSAGAETVAGNGIFLVSLSSDGQVVEKPVSSLPAGVRPGGVVTVPGRTKAGVTTNITCDVYGYGPETDGRDVRFEVLILCNGGVPLQLIADLEIRRYENGEFVTAPGSVTHCGTVNDPILDECVAHTKCYMAGDYYYGDARLHALDELGEPHDIELWTYVFYLPCTI